MQQLNKYAIIGIVISFIMASIFMMSFFIMLMGGGNSSNTDGSEFLAVSEKTLAWRDEVELACDKYGIPNQVNVILAIIEQESGGDAEACGGDIMQASESIGLPPGGITDPLVSIDVGVSYYASNYTLAQSTGEFTGKEAEDIAIQGYNYGTPYVTYALEAGGYSIESAYAYSEYMAGLMGWDSYGDPDYVPHVREYLIPNPSGVINPCEGYLTSTFGMRNGTMHYGIDIGNAEETTPILAVADGTVVKSYYSDSYGEVVMISHTINNQEWTTVYAHMAEGSRTVEVGEKVTQGQTIGYMGNSGESEGKHLHFEVHKGAWNEQKSNAVDPLLYVSY